MDFTQINSYPFIDEKKKEKGNLVVSFPDKFAWTSTSEDSVSSTIVSNGKTIWFYQAPDDPRDKGQLFINSASESVNIPSILISCPEDNFVSYIKTGSVRTIYVTGGEDKNYKWAKIKYKTKPFKFIELYFESFSSSKTTIIANSFKLNKTPPAKSLFEFQIPAGTRIIK